MDKIKQSSSQQDHKDIGELLECAIPGLNRTCKLYGFSVRLVEIKNTWYIYPELEQDLNLNLSHLVDQGFDIDPEK